MSRTSSSDEESPNSDITPRRSYTDASEEEEAELLSTHKRAPPNKGYTFTKEDYAELATFVFAKASFVAGPHQSVAVAPAELMQIVRRSNTIDQQRRVLFSESVEGIIVAFKWGKKKLTDTDKTEFNYLYRKKMVTQTKSELLGMIAHYQAGGKYVITPQNYDKALNLSERLRTIFAK